jgi:hypothetical protein
MEPIAEASTRVFQPKFVGRMVGVGYLVLTASGFDVLWLSIKGVDEKRWHEQAGPAAQW